MNGEDVTTAGKAYRTLRAEWLGAECSMSEERTYRVAVDRLSRAWEEEAGNEVRLRREEFREVCRRYLDGTASDEELEAAHGRVIAARKAFGDVHRETERYR